jgi:GGDEF domain-containing protein
MPGADRQAAQAMLETIQELLKINNQFYSNAPLDISVGLATSEEGETMEAMVRRADLAMYEQKRAHHASRKAAPSAAL